MAFAHVVPTPPFSPDSSDAELVTYTIDGNDDAFQIIMQRYNRLLFRTARSMLRRDADAEDALQDAYLKAWLGIGTFRAEAKLSTWLVRIVINEAQARLRRKHTNVILLEEESRAHQPETQAFMMENPKRNPDQLAMQSQLRGILEEQIDRLPDMYRTVFMLRAIEELSTREVSEALQLPEATVRTHYFRARSLLRKGLAAQIDTSLHDAFSFGGDRCQRIVTNVMSRLKEQATR